MSEQGVGELYDRLKLDCDYVYWPREWDSTYSVSDANDFVNDLFEGTNPGAVVEIGRLALLTTKFAVKIPTVFDNDGWAEEHEIRLFNSELHAERAYASAMEATPSQPSTEEAK